VVRDYAADLADFLRQVVGRPAALFGHSLGALAALTVAGSGTKLLGLALSDPPAPSIVNDLDATSFGPQFRGMHKFAAAVASTAERAKMLADMVVSKPKATVVKLGDIRDPASLRWMAACLGKCDPAAIAAFIENRWLEGLDVAELAGSVMCPTLLLQADPLAGGMLPDEEVASLTAPIADVTRIRYRGIGHLLHWFDPVGTLNPTLAFLESLR
jgi:pimeloyl-ACP methyl ester carboxylesterase